mmetsp:Transcript_20713/g.26735  ORF Transcript_20713/g.26735 Transcript_20713/m.26735 type:complete len:489 (-) Transcript_20713:26-1492(-)
MGRGSASEVDDGHRPLRDRGYHAIGDVELIDAALDDQDRSNSVSLQTAKQIEWNFFWMCILFGANHGCVVSCLSLATKQFASIGAWQTAILYITYTGSAIFGATGVVKYLGGRDALVAGMALYCVYVAAFLAATLLPDQQRLLAYSGAGVGGIGAGFLWTAQGAYFTMAAEKHANASGHPLEQSTNKFGSTFAFYYLALEVILRIISSLVGSVKAISWTVIFAVYFLVALSTTIGMLGVQKFDEPSKQGTAKVWFNRSTVTLQLLWHDRKMKYMIGLNAVFGFTSAFLNSYVNGEVVGIVFQKSNMIGVLTAWLAIVAALLSKVFAPIANIYGKGTILVVGSICFALVVIPFVVYPNVHKLSPFFLLFVYTMHGAGRATFEGTLKAVFADFFGYEKEGAFANIIFQNGLASALGFALSSGFSCDHEAGYCVKFHDGTLHNMSHLEWLVIGTSLLGILGYLVASSLHDDNRGSRTASLPQDEEENNSIL